MNDAEVDDLDLSGWPLPETYLKELGRIVSLWTALESLLNVSIGKLAGFDDPFDPKPFILVNHMSIPQKLDVISALCEHLSPQFKHLSTYKSVISQARVAQSARNKFLHNGLARNEETGEIHIAQGSARGTLKTKVKPVTLTDIRRASVDIHLATLALHNLLTGKNERPIWERQ